VHKLYPTRISCLVEPHDSANPIHLALCAEPELNQWGFTDRRQGLKAQPFGRNIHQASAELLFQLNESKFGGGLSKLFPPFWDHGFPFHRPAQSRAGSEEVEKLCPGGDPWQGWGQTTGSRLTSGVDSKQYAKSL
jgi:hypothetical protein